MDIAFERMAMVKISDGRTQPIGASTVSQRTPNSHRLQKKLTERVGKVHIVDIYKSNAHPTSSLMRTQRISISTNNGADNHERDACTGGAAHKEGAATDLIDKEEGWDGAEAVDDAVDACCKEGGRVAV
jgi:hypothetical protein